MAAAAARIPKPERGRDRDRDCGMFGKDDFEMLAHGER